MLGRQTNMRTERKLMKLVDIRPLLTSKTRGKHMRILTIATVSFIGFFSNVLQAQITNFLLVQPMTRLESFDTNTSVVILKASTDAGTITADSGAVSVRCREITDTSTGKKEQGIAVEILPRNQTRNMLLIDYDEISSLTSAIDYLSKLEVTSTPLTSFDAAYTTKGGFRIAALGTRSTGAIQFGVRDARVASVPVTFSRDQMSRLSDIINQAKGILDSLRR